MLWTIPLVTTLASGAYDLWQSNKQGKRAEELARNNVRPEMEIPQSELDSLASAKNQAQLSRLPGQSATEGRLDQITANKVAQVERAGVGGPTSINAASTAYSQQQEKENELGIEAAKMKLRNQEILRDELDENAQWQQKAWDWNTGQPYMQKQQAIASLRGAQTANRNTGLKNLIGGLGNTALMGALGMDGKPGGGDGWFDGLFSKGAPKTEGTPNPYDFSNPAMIDPYQNPQVNTSGYEIQPGAEPMNFTDKMLTNPYWGNF